MKVYKLFIFITLLSIAVRCQDEDAIDYAVDPENGISNVKDDDVIATIMNLYNNQIRPSKTVNISIKISIRQLLSLDQVNQVMTTNIYLSAYWLDPRLKWDPIDYSNLSDILIPANKLWLPDFNIINTADSSVGFVTVSASNLAIVNKNGLVYLITGISGLKTRCALDAYYYPYDKQNCSILIGSWQHDTTRLNFLSDDNKVDISNYIPNPVWNLLKVNVYSVFSSNRFLSTEGYTSEDIGFYLLLRRGSLYSMINNVFPCFILNGVTLIAYFLPHPPQIALSNFY